MTTEFINWVQKEYPSEWEIYTWGNTYVVQLMWSAWQARGQIK